MILLFFFFIIRDLKSLASTRSRFDRATGGRRLKLGMKEPKSERIARQVQRSNVKVSL